MLVGSVEAGEERAPAAQGRGTVAVRPRGRWRQHQSLISKIENGQVDVRIGNVGEIAAALGVHPRELFED